MVQIGDGISNKPKSLAAKCRMVSGAVFGNNYQALKEQIRCYIARLPEDFTFQLNEDFSLSACTRLRSTCIQY